MNIISKIITLLNMKTLLILSILSLFLFTSCGSNYKERTVCGKIIAITKLTYIHTTDRCRISVYDSNRIPISEEFTYDSVKDYKVGDSICLVIFERELK
jgi:hypothetical protein